MTNQMIEVRQHGGPEELIPATAPVPEPGPDEILIRHKAIAVNFIDIYFRTGLYPAALPLVPGLEAAGIVEQVGANVADFKPGDRVAYGDVPGAYSTWRCVSSNRVVPLPDGVTFDQAATLMIRGMTVDNLIRRTFPVTAETKVLWHAVTGGVGQVAVRWLKHLGATVIGTVGSAGKIGPAQALGCDAVIDYSQDTWVEAVKSAANGPVNVVYDGVGAATFLRSLDCLAPMGMMVTFGNASGPPPDISPLLLSKKGSLFLTRPTVMHYIARRDDLLTSANNVFQALMAGHIEAPNTFVYPLAEAARAHQDLQDRKILGAAVLHPED